jgi:TRAP-type C4-dicarboxylate transport system substrate-binding protein
MRVMTSPILVEAYKAYGANPTPLPFSEVYSSLQLNMIEGQENPYATIQEMKFYEVTDYMITAKHRMYVISMSSNASFFNSLPSEIQKMVLESVSESLDYYYTFENDFNSKRLQQIMQDKPSYKHITLTPEEIAVFKEKSKGAKDVYVEMVGPTGAEVLKAIETDIQNAK